MIKVVIQSENGMHARPASQIVSACNAYESEIFINHQDTQANARSIMNLLGLGISKGDEVEVVADGPDADEAEQAIAKILGEAHD